MSNVEVTLLGPWNRAALDHVAPEVFDNPVDPDWTKEFFDDPRHHLAIAIANGLVVGMASAVHYIHPDKPPELWINEVAVTPRHRREGVASRLLESLFSRARELGCGVAWVLTDRGNTAAMELYHGAGGKEQIPQPVMFEFMLDAGNTASQP